jgi:hypothetical protein
LTFFDADVCWTPPATHRTRARRERGGLHDDAGAMDNLLLVSIMIAMIVLPVRAAGDRSAIRGLRRAMAGMAFFVAFYVFVLLDLWLRL